MIIGAFSDAGELARELVVGRALVAGLRRARVEADRRDAGLVDQALRELDALAARPSSAPSGP